MYASQDSDVHSDNLALYGAIRLAIGFASLKLLFHVLSALWQQHIGYGYFRDEFYYIACGRHLAWGYVDHGPLVAVQAHLSETLFGHSLLGLRFLSAVGGATRVFLTGMLAWTLGGRRPAQALAMVMVLTAPMYLAQDGYLSMNSWESTFWMTCVFAILRLQQGQSEKVWWSIFGISAGLGLLNKPSLTFFLIALCIALLLTPQRRILYSRHAAFGIALLLLIATPNLAWQIHHNWPTYEFLHNGRINNKNIHLPPLSFLWNQILVLGPWTAFVWFPGLLRTLRKRDLRWIGVAFLLFLAGMLLMGAKDYYVTPVYPVLFAAGGVAWERRYSLRKRVQRNLTVAFPVVFATATSFALLLLPQTTPVLVPEAYIRYVKAIHLPSSNSENYRSGMLPQFFADRFGWQEEADAVSRIVAQLSPEDRKVAAIVCDNYGEAGALEFLGHHLPPVLSGHNNYWLWGTHGATGQVMILIEGSTLEHLQQLFESVRIVGHMDSPYSMPYEHHNIYIARGPKFGSLKSIWPNKKDYI